MQWCAMSYNWQEHVCQRIKLTRTATICSCLCSLNLETLAKQTGALDTSKAFLCLQQYFPPLHQQYFPLYTKFNICSLKL
jgi:hypothetical protein